MNLRNLIVPLAISCLLVACSSGPVRKVHPSTASIQQLAVLPDGRWKITLRIENFSTMAMHYSTLKAKLTVDGGDAGEIHVTPDMDITGNSGDVVEAILRPSTNLGANSDVAYQLKGTIDTSEPKAHFPFDRSSRLSPVPGMPNTWR